MARKSRPFRRLLRRLARALRLIPPPPPRRPRPRLSRSSYLTAPDPRAGMVADMGLDASRLTRGAGDRWGGAPPPLGPPGGRTYAGGIGAQVR